MHSLRLIAASAVLAAAAGANAALVVTPTLLEENGVTIATTTFDLTSEGTLGWAKMGNYPTSNVIQKAAGVPISYSYAVGVSGLDTPNNFIDGFTWIDGPVDNVTGTDNKGKLQNQGNNAVHTVGALLGTDSERTLNIYLGQYACNATLTIKTYDAANNVVNADTWSDTYNKSSGAGWIANRISAQFSGVDRVEAVYSFIDGTGSNGPWNSVSVAAASLTGVPEPSSLMLIGALGGAALARRRRHA